MPCYRAQLLAFILHSKHVPYIILHNLKLNKYPQNARNQNQNHLRLIQVRRI